MAIRKPLVLVSGQIQQLQAGDSISEVGVINLTNGEAGAIVIGAPVYVSAADTVKKAKSDASGTLPVVGLVAQPSITNAVAGAIQMDGILAATTGQWDAVAGTSGGLTANTRYYVSNATAGLLTSTAPTTGFVQEIGIAISTTEMFIEPKNVFQL